MPWRRLLLVMGLVGCGGGDGTARLVVDPPTLLADGRTTATVTVTLRDGDDGIGGERVELEVLGGGAALDAASGTTDAHGVFQTTLRATEGGTKQLHARIAGQRVEAALEVTSLAPACTETVLMPGLPMAALPGSAVAADFDGDSLVDLATVPYAPEPVILARGRGDGTFETPADVTPSYRANLMRAADLDGDGAIDLVDATPYDAVTIRRNLGDGTFAAPVPIALGFDTGVLEPADVDGDGAIDLVGVHQLGIDVQLGGGAGDQTSRIRSSLAAPPTTTLASAALADFDGDGALDAVLSRRHNSGPFPVGGPAEATTTSLAFTHGNGDGTFAAPVAIAGTPGSLVALDYDGDGNADLLGLADNRIYLHRGRGDGTFDAPTSFAFVRPGALRVQAGDLDGDGLRDLVLAGARVGVLRATGAGTFAEPVLYSVGTGDANVALVDVEADGDLDVIALGALRSAILTNTGAGAFVAPSPVGDTPLAAVAPIELGAERWPDLVGARGPELVALHGNGDGTFAESPLGSVDEEVVAIVPVDVDRDGHTDLAVADATGLTILRLGSDGARTTARIALGEVVQIPSYAIGDFTGDGVPDIVANDPVEYGLTLYVGAGDGRFPDARPLPLDDNAGREAALAADFNRDGKLDLVAANSWTVTVMLGAGDGTFGAPRLAPGDVRPPLLVADLDADGLPDVVGTGGQNASFEPTSVRVLLGTGDGELQLGGGAPVFNLSQLATADIDRDGNLDVLASAGPSSQDLLVLYGTGMGQLAPAVAYPAGQLAYPRGWRRSNLGPLAVLDADTDGRLDVVMSDGTALLQRGCDP